MTSINFVGEILKRKKRIAEGEKGESAGGGFLAKLRGLGGGGGGGEGGLTLEAREKTMLMLGLLGIASIFGGRYYVTDVMIPPLRKNLTDRVEQINTDIAAERNKLAQFDSIKNEIDQYDKQMAELRTKLQLIESVQKNRNSIVRMVDFVITELPENVWLSDVSVDISTKTGAGMGKVDLSGKALSMQLVSEFVKRLEGAVFFPRWDLAETVSSQETGGSGANVKSYESKSFKISAEVTSL
jgi:Tfp pilus assembly protein PilN